MKDDGSGGYVVDYDQIIEDDVDEALWLTRILVHALNPYYEKNCSFDLSIHLMGLAAGAVRLNRDEQEVLLRRWCKLTKQDHQVDKLVAQLHTMYTMEDAQMLKKRHGLRYKVPPAEAVDKQPQMV